MKKCILIGFQYSNSNSCVLEDLYLPGILTDLMRIYKRTKIMKCDETIIISDIDIVSTIFPKTKSIIYSTGDFEEQIEQCCLDSDQIFFYYTGHAKNGCFILPHGRLIQMTTLCEIISESMSIMGQLFCLLDCCNSTGFGLSFKMIKDGSFQLNKTNSVYKQQILCISSSLENERSVCTKSGSIFTRNISKLLKHNKKNLLDIYSNTCSSNKNKIQTTSITCSHPNVHELWSWIFGKGNLADEFRCLLFNG